VVVLQDPSGFVAAAAAGASSWQRTEPEAIREPASARRRRRKTFPRDPSSADTRAPRRAAAAQAPRAAMRAAAAAPVACLLALLSTAAALPAPSAGSLFGLRGGDALPIEIRAAGAAASPPDANITVDVGAAVRFQETLYGAFFEEIGHAGDGGLFAELVQDRSFDALAAAAGFSSSSKNGARLEVDLGALGAASAARSAAAVAQRAALAAATAAAGGSPHGSLAAARRRHVEAPNAPAVAWSALPGTQTALSRAAPLAAGNPVALEVRPPREDGSYGAGGVVNSGYWGVWLREGGEYGASLFVRNPGSEAANVTLALLSADLETLHARLELSAPPGGAWTRLAGKLRAAADDRDARLAVLVYAPVVLDTVSLFPAENVRRGEAMGLTTPYPFRADLLQRLKDLAPAFLRIPGGCFVEGDKLANAFRWKPTVGPAETRPGHWNLWGYRATDGLGIFEYLLLAEELGARPIWVINAGVAHADSELLIYLLHGSIDSIVPFVLILLCTFLIRRRPDRGRLPLAARRARRGRVHFWPVRLALGRRARGDGPRGALGARVPRDRERELRQGESVLRSVELHGRSLLGKHFGMHFSF
jgi:hypothetical protein